MINIGRFSFKSETEFFQYTVEKYFRKVPPVPTNIYLKENSSQILENRIKMAKLCHFPSVINTLYRDENEAVRKSVEKNDFWILIGKLQDVLGFEKKERRQFARREVSKILVVLLMFEDDLDILGEVLRNPSISIKMINLYINLLKERGRGKKDEQIRSEAIAVLKEKKSRILKASVINKAGKNLNDIKNIELLIYYLADDDKVIRKAVKNIVLDSDPVFISQMIEKIIENNKRSNPLTQFICASEIIDVVRKRDNLKRVSIEYLKLPSERLHDGQHHTVAEYFNYQLNSKKRMLIKSCLEDLTNFDSVIMLTYGHCDMNREIRQLAENILPLEDLFSLVKDISTPQKVFKSILNILSEHPEETVHQRVDQIFQEESKRLWNRLKELETMMEACFDVIFQSLGFTEINQYVGAFKSLELSEKFLQKFWKRFTPSLQQKIETSQPILKEVRETFETAIYKIEADVSKDRLIELDQVQNMVEQIIDLKKFDIEGLRQGASESLDKNLLKKTRRIWQSALGQFLGRIKSLDEMLKVKFEKLAEKEVAKNELIESDFKEVIIEIEELHKNKVNCSLPHPCQDCMRRGCAAERYLTQVHFINQELLDNFVED